MCVCCVRVCVCKSKCENGCVRGGEKEDEKERERVPVCVPVCVFVCPCVCVCVCVCVVVPELLAGEREGEDPDVGQLLQDFGPQLVGQALPVEIVLAGGNGGGGCRPKASALGARRPQLGPASGE